MSGEPRPHLVPGPDFDLTAVSPEEFVALVRAADDEQIASVVRGMGTETVLDRVFAGFAERFRPERAGGVRADVQFVVREDDREHAYVLSMDRGGCRSSRGPAPRPKVTISTGLVPFMRLLCGDADGMQLFLAGRLKVSGNLLFAPRIMGFFDQVEP